MTQQFFGQKLTQTQAFLEDGSRIPVTRVYVPDLSLVHVKTQDTDGYSAWQVGFGTKKHANKPTLGHIKGAKLEKAPRFLRELKVEEGAVGEKGTLVKAIDVLKPGDIIDVYGISKGKGYAGGVKRHNFKGGPRTHGQSDRERAPGSIGQTTTPGRVYKGKRMAGHMGVDKVTVKNLLVVDITSDNMLLIKGLVPGPRESMIMITKVGESKKFSPLFKVAEELPQEEITVEEPKNEGAKE